MLIGHKLSDIEKKLLQARLDESQMINSGKLEYFTSYEHKILEIIQVADDVMVRCYTKEIFDARHPC